MQVQQSNIPKRHLRDVFFSGGDDKILKQKPMIISDEQGLLNFLDGHHIAYQRVEHPPVHTCEEADRLRVPLPAVHTKNLFLRDESKQHFFLAVTACGKRVNTAALGRQLGVRKLHMASAAVLRERLGIAPGAVTMLALINDVGHQVELVIDEEIWSQPAFTCHPLVNTATLVLTKEGLIEFFRLTGHPVRTLRMAAG